MKVSQMFPTRFICGNDLNGKAFIMTIREIRKESVRSMNGENEERYVLYFQEAHKGLLLNKTIANQISTILASDDTGIWTGKKIKLVPEEITVAGQQRMTVRARPADDTAAAAVKQGPAGAYYEDQEPEEESAL